jgi:exonuclease III
MRNYLDLRLRSSDTPEEKARKQHVAERLRALRVALRAHIGEDANQRPHPHPDHWIRLATWNIREFPSAKYGRRFRDESYYYIAEILSAFDVIALQEIREDLRGLDDVMDLLGEGWSYVATDVTEGKSGNHERMVFVYNTRKARFKNIAGEVVLSDPDEIAYPHEERLAWPGLDLELPPGTSLESPKDVDTYKWRDLTKLEAPLRIPLPEGTKLVLPKGTDLVLPARKTVELTPDRRVKLPWIGHKIELENRDISVDLPKRSIVGDTLQFARTPFLVNIKAGWLDLMLCTVHIYYGDTSERSVGMRRRKAEIRELTKFMSERAKKEYDTDAARLFILLGDFNIVGKDHGTMTALKSDGFNTPDALQRLPGTNVDKTKAYDQIAYWSPPPDAVSDQAGGVIKVEEARAGVFDFFETVFRDGAQDPDGVDVNYYTPMMNKMHDDINAEGEWTYREWRTYQMSDHLPMWVELRVDFGDAYLEAIENA